MGRLLTKSRNGVITSYSYDATGQLTNIQLPEGRTILYTYTADGKINTIEDSLGNRVIYAYDLRGHKSREEIQDPQGVLQRFVDYSYEDTGRLDTTTYADGSSEQLDYDELGNLIARVNALNKTTSYAYDALNRLTNITEPGSTITGYTYDANDNLTEVTDAKGNTTSFTYDDFGRKIYRFSPDTGQTFYAYDAADNLIAKTGANGIIVSYEYDALNRLLAVRYPDSTQNINYTYDLWDNGIGKLSTMHDTTGETSYLYDPQGRVVVEKRTIGGLTFNIDYWYNDSSELTSVIYPGGRTVDYQRDGAGRVISVTSTFDGVTETLAQNSTYLPFGPLTGTTLGNGVSVSNTYDRMYRLTNATAGTLYNRSYQWNEKLITSRFQETGMAL